MPNNCSFFQSVQWNSAKKKYEEGQKEKPLGFPEGLFSEIMTQKLQQLEKVYSCKSHTIQFPTSGVISLDSIHTRCSSRIVALQKLHFKRNRRLRLRRPFIVGEMMINWPLDRQ